MKNIILFIIAIAISGNTLCQWTQLNSGTGQKLEDIDCPSTNVCYVAGDAGTILKTTDGGQTWVSKTNGLDVTEYYNSIDCIDENTCFTAHGNGGLYKTTDGGDTWVEKNMPAGSITKIFMTNSSIGYASPVGAYLKTIDGGENWTWETSSLHFGTNTSIFFFNQDTGYFAFGDATDMGVIKTTDGGNNWSYSLTGISCPPKALHFSTISFGILVGSDGCAYRTTDQGASWDTLNTGTSKILEDIWCVDEDTCYIVGSTGASMLKTTDGGNTWASDLGSAPSANYLSIDFPSQNVGYAVGWGGTIIKKDYSTGFGELKDNSPSINIFPNPATEETIIYYAANNSSFNKSHFEVFDVLGKKVSSQELNQGNNKLKNNDLFSGMYLYTVVSDNTILQTGKLMVN